MTSLRQRAVTAFLWDYGGSLAGMGATFVLGVLLARLLTPEEFGQVAMVTVFIGLTQGLMDLGLGVSLVQRKNIEAVHYNSAFWLNTGLGLVLAAIAFAAAPLVARFYGEPALIAITRVLAWGFVLRGLTIVHQARLTKLLRLKLLTVVRLAAAVLAGSAGVTLALAGFGVWSLVTQSLLGSALTLVGLWLFGGWRPGRECSRRALTDLWSFGLPMFGAGLLDTVVTRIDVLVVGKLFAAADLGFFTRAKSIVRTVVRLSSASVGKVMLPVMAEIQDDDERFRTTLLKTLSLVSFVAFGLCAWLFVVADPLIVVLLTEKWRPAAVMLRLFSLSAWSIPVNTVILSALKGRGRSGTFFGLEVVKKSVYFLALVVGFHWGIRGYLLALVAVAVVNTGVNLAGTAPHSGARALRIAATFAPYGGAAWVVIFGCAWLPLTGMTPIEAFAISTVAVAAGYLLVSFVFAAEGPRLGFATARNILRGGYRA